MQNHKQMNKIISLHVEFIKLKAALVDLLTHVTHFQSLLVVWNHRASGSEEWKSV